VIKGGAAASILPAFKNVCNKPECIAEMNNTCSKIHPCGHPCGGFANETQCLPCLEPDCITKYNSTAAVQKKIPDGHKNSDYCAICYTQGLEEKPCVQLACRHIMHLDCIMKILK